jgi:hypothetical protein
MWEVGTNYGQDLLELLRTLLQSVTWQEALARACAEVLEGTWANKYVGTPGGDAPPVLALGSGKTRMGAYLIAALMQRFLLGEGRARADLRPLLICPPGVVDRWQRRRLF